MTAMTALDAIRSIAGPNGLELVHDSGPCLDGRHLVYGDPEFAEDYLNGPGTAGTVIRVWFNRRGEVDRASKRVDDEPAADVTGTRGDAGSRLLWTLQMFVAEDPDHLDGEVAGE